MKKFTSGSIFESVLQKAILEVPDDKRKDLPLGIVMLETDGTLSSLHVPSNSDSDSMFSLLALEYILYSFDRQDWMAEFLVSMKNLEASEKRSKVHKNRAKLTLIQGGKIDEEGWPSGLRYWS